MLINPRKITSIQRWHQSESLLSENTESPVLCAPTHRSNRVRFSGLSQASAHIHWCHLKCITSILVQYHSTIINHLDYSWTHNCNTLFSSNQKHNSHIQSQEVSSLFWSILFKANSPWRIHNRGLHPRPGRETMIDSERFLLESSDRSPHLGETRDTVLQTKHADLDTLNALDTLDTRLDDDLIVGEN